MGVKVIELNGDKKYKEWIETNGDRIEIIDVQSATEKWNVWTGAIGSALKGGKKFTVTYKDKAR